MLDLDPVAQVAFIKERERFTTLGFESEKNMMRTVTSLFALGAIGWVGEVQAQTLAELVGFDGSLSTLASAVSAADLNATLSGEGPFTYVLVGHPWMDCVIFPEVPVVLEENNVEARPRFGLFLNTILLSLTLPFSSGLVFFAA